MDEKVIKLFNENYQNKGLCENLPKFAKKIVKLFKKTNQEKTILYYPWAVIERIFRLQGGKVEVLDWAKKVEFVGSDYAPNEQGELVMTEQSNKALFLHLKATWQGEEEEEFYPIFDNQNAKIIKTPDALDLNTARQRGMVRLIARLSGIGLDIFEQQEGQFDNSDDVIEEGKGNKTIKVTEKKSTPAQEEIEEEVVIMKEKPKATPKPKKEEPKKEEPEKEEPNFMEAFLKGDIVEVVEKVEAIEEAQKTFAEKEEYGNDTEEYAAMLLEVRKTIRETNTQEKAKAYIKSKNKELLSHLKYTELVDLKKKLF